MSTANDVSLNVTLSADLKLTIEEAAAQLGQTVSDFAVSALVQTARRVIQEHCVTSLTQRDREVFTQLLDEQEAKPNKRLSEAAEQYKKQAG